MGSGRHKLPFFSLSMWFAANSCKQASQACECLGSTIYQQLVNADAGKSRQYIWCCRERRQCHRHSRSHVLSCWWWRSHTLQFWHLVPEVVPRWQGDHSRDWGFIFVPIWCRTAEGGSAIIRLRLQLVLFCMILFLLMAICISLINHVGGSAPHNHVCTYVMLNSRRWVLHHIKCADSSVPHNHVWTYVMSKQQRVGLPSDQLCWWQCTTQLHFPHARHHVVNILLNRTHHIWWSEERWAAESQPFMHTALHVNMQCCVSSAAISTAAILCKCNLVQVYLTSNSDLVISCTTM